MASVVVFGSANMDHVVRMDAFPAPGETVAGLDYRTVPGGKGLNQAVAAARAGADVAFVGAVGSDADGAAITALLEAEGIDVDGLATVASPTGSAHISVSSSGENQITIVAGANGTVREPPRILGALLASADYLVLQCELPQSAIDAAVALAEQHGTTVVLTPAPVRVIAAETLAGVDLLVPNQHEAAQLAGVDDAEGAALALSRSVGTVVVTLGADGALVARDGAVVDRIPGVPAEAVDTTAAGDTFVGVLVASLAAGSVLSDALRRATRAASISVTRAGATSSMPTAAEIDA